jgi:septal ring-binding cell division protein DamX/type II secretory pathway predicted ATPase ExeA
MDALSHYVEPASRTQLVSKLRHLVRFSDLMLMIIGVNGSGRSTVLTQLKAQDAQGDRREVLLRFDETVDVTRLLTSLSDALDLDCPADADNRVRLTALHQYSRTLHEAGVPLILLLDDADYLTNNALELLTNFAVLEDAAPRIVLTGTPEFEQRFLANELDQLLDGRLHVQLLEPFEEDEAEAFLQEFLPPGTELSPKQIRRLVDDSGGLPGLLHRALLAQIRDGAIKRRSARAFPLPRLHLAAIVLVLIAIFGTSLWLYLPDSMLESEEATTRVVLPIDLPVPAATEPATPVIDVREELQQRLREQEQQLAEMRTAVGADAEPAAAESTDTPVASAASAAADPADVAAVPADRGTPVESVDTVATGQPSARTQPEAGAVEPAKTAQATVPAERAPGAPGASIQTVTEAVAPAPAATAPGSAPARETAVAAPATGDDRKAHSLSRADELLEWPDSGYTLQLLAARAVESVEKFLAAQPNPERFYYFETVYKNAPWHVVVYGQFADRTAAMNAVATLPPELRKLRPWARSIAGVKADIRK